MSSRPGTSSAFALGAIATAVAALSCGGDSNPAAPRTAKATATSPATATSVPAANADAVPGLSGACYRLGPGSANATCGQGGSPQLVDEVETAIDWLVQNRPQLFDKTDVSAPGTNLYKVVDRDGYLDGVAQLLRMIGVCAQRDPQDPAYERILAKTTNELSEAYDVLTSDGYIRRGSGSFVDLCRPASFPVERAPETPPPGSGCLAPYPPPVTRMLCTVHLRTPEYDTLDSTPLVGPDTAYCASIGYTDARSWCPVRMSEAPDRVACETWRVGTAKDTGRPGPTWTKGDGSYCRGLQTNGCQNSPDNQFQLRVFAGGPYVVSAANGVSCTVTSGR
jgi:hypothetical protein